MRRGIAAFGLVLSIGAFAMLQPAAAFAKGHEQVVFSGEGEGSLGEAEFWIWCAVDPSGAYDDCNGAMRFDDLHLTKHVEGEVSEPEEGVYLMEVASRDGSVSCSLENVPPITHGHTNEVDILCSSPSGDAVSTDAVVVVTG
jgi:hypothetical protein